MSSEQKIRVTADYGSDCTVAMMDPLIGMNVRRGFESYWIVSVSGGPNSNLVGLALSSGGTEVEQSYAHEITLSSGGALGWAHPTGIGEIVFGHHGETVGGSTGLGKAFIRNGQTDGITQHTY